MNYVNINDWAEGLGLSMRNVRKDIKNGLLQATKIGSTYVAKKEWIDTYLKELAKKQTNE